MATTVKRRFNRVWRHVMHDTYLILDWLDASKLVRAIPEMLG